MEVGYSERTHVVVEPRISMHMVLENERAYQRAAFRKMCLTTTLNLCPLWI